MRPLRMHSLLSYLLDLGGVAASVSPDLAATALARGERSEASGPNYLLERRRMDGATLRLLDSLRGVSYPGGPHTRSALEAFARLLFGWPLDPSQSHWIEDLAERAELQWNGDRAEPFRIIYQDVRAQGQRIDVSDD